MPHSKIGFTLVELVISIALSAVILLIAVSAFRQATQTMTLMNRMSTESGLLRTGYFLSGEDVDFWNSAANPDYPYLKGHMSDAVVKGADAGNNLDNKRIFKQVKFKKATEFNPNWLQPNDKRSWYRNYFMQSPRAYGFDRSTGTPATGYQVRPVFGNSTSPYDNFDDDVNPNFNLPIGWEPWHIWGDYTLTSNLGMKESGAPSALDSLEGARPTLMWDIFKQIGHTGVYTYMPPGTINLILRPATNNTVANIGLPNKHFDKGEIPWSLTVPNTVTPAPTYDPATMNVPTNADAPGNVLGHYFFGMPGARGRLANIPPKSWPNFPSFSIADAEYGTGNPHWFADLEDINGETFWQDYDSQFVQKPSRISIGMFLGSKFTSSSFSGGVFSPVALIDTPTRDPWLALDKDVEHPATFEETNRTTVFWRQARDYTSVTVHIPRNMTDDPRPDMGSTNAGSPSLSTSILRYRYKGADRVICTIRVQDPTTGHVMQIGYSLLGSTLRGARQHWGWKTSVDDPTLKPMGDIYE